MRSVVAVFKRELKAYVTQPIAYVTMGSLLLIVGLLYYLSFSQFLMLSFQAMRDPMLAQQLDLSPFVVGQTIGTIGAVSVFTLPLITVRFVVIHANRPSGRGDSLRRGGQS